MLRWSHRFRVNAPVDALYEKGFAPDNWFSFFNQYRGLESVDAHWPHEGSSIAVRVALGPWTVRIRNTVVEHEWGKRLYMYEEALGGLWVDRVEFIFRPGQGATEVTLTTHPTTRRWWGWPLILLLWPWGARETPRAMRRFGALVEEGLDQEG